jgi:lysyl-tRNA synthetase class 2
LVYPAGAEALSLREFNAKFGDIEETKTETVSVFGKISDTKMK